jgi:hypothetical protein
MVETQTSRERVLAVLVGEEADRPPVTPTGGWWVAQTSGLPLPEVFAKGEVLAAAHLDVQRRAGYDAVYTYFDALAIPEAFGCRVELKEFGDRLLATSASWTHNLPTLRELVKENRVEIHPETARRLGIRDGARVAVETPRGRIELLARVCETVPSSVVSIPVGWGHVASGRLAASTPGANPNVLIDHTNIDPIAGTAGYKCSLCRVTRC